MTNENDNDPIFNSGNSAGVAENQSADTVVYTAMATDADEDSLTYSLSGTDAARFTVDPNTGAVRFIASPDFENPDDAGGDNVYNITVTASDDTNESNHDVAITVTNENDNDPIFISGNSVGVLENQPVDSVVYTAIASDADGDTLTYRLSGTDASLFTIDPATGDIRFITVPDVEAPGDANRHNVYEITVTASDDTNDIAQAVAITVTNVNEDAPSFTSPDSASVAENQTVAYTAAATDADGDPLIYGLSGTDAALFTIDPATGVVSFITPPDFEDPGDAGGNNIYNITVTASDGDNSTNHNVAITVTNENDNDPSFTSDASVSVAENQTAAYTALATDADGDPLTYSLSGTDAGLFTIDPATGVVSFNEAPDAENPDDANGDNVYDIIVTASDNTEGTTDTNQAVAITVTNVNDNAPVFTSPDSASVAENQTAAYMAVATDADEDPLTYSLSGTDAARFTINETTGEVSFNEAPDVENPDDANGDNVYNIVVTASDNTEGTTDTNQAVAITVTGVNDNAPVFTSPGTASVMENQTAAYTALATDGDGDALSYSLSGTDAGLFTIDPATGVVSFSEAPDAENPDDANGDNVYDIVVTASDNTGGTPDTTQAVAITVTGVNDNAPVFTSPGTASVEENQTAAYTAVATDGDGDPLTYSLSGTDAGLFTIDPATGVVSFNETPDAENPDDANGDKVYDIIVTASDNTGGTPDTTQAVAITVTGVNDNAPVFTSPDSASVAENQTVAYTTQATDADGDALSYSLSGTDAALFTIDANTGEVRFNEAPDAENPGDDDNDNVYDIIVTASDNTAGTTDTDQAVAITVTNANDNAPAFSSPATASVAENQTVAYTAMAADADAGDTVSYSLSGGADSALFTIDPATGVVSFQTPPDFEAPGSADGDNVYDITVTASDNTAGTTDTNQAVTITVTNVNDNAPAFSSPATASVAENQTVAYTAMAADADAGDTVSYSLSGGADAALFTIDPATGVVSFQTPPDFEAPGSADGDNVYDITVTASDNTAGTTDTDQAVAITVTNVNDNAPVFSSPATAGVAENQTAAYTAQATDADGDTLNYSLSGTDAGLFTIDATTGAVSFVAPPDFEMPDDDDGDNVYDIIVTASDGVAANNIDQAVAITVTNENDNTPVFSSPASAEVAENQSAATVVYTAAATDADGDTLGYSLSGTDAGLFTIDATTGAVSFVAPPDFENPGDDDGDNVYDIIVTASDGAAANDVDQAVAITVTDEYEPFELSMLDGGNGFTLPGIDANDESGASVSSAGDVNGDGYDDLIISAHLADPNGSASGETYVVYGGASVPVDENGEFALSSLDGSNGFTVNGIFAFDQSGRSVSSAGDVNGDGYDDLIIGARFADPNGNSLAGVTYVVYGGASVPVDENGGFDLSSLDGGNGFTLNGIDDADFSGTSVSSAGDVNGDGYDDLIIGASYSDPGGNSGAGETYVVYGGASAPGTAGALDLSALDGSNGFILTGIDTDDNSGRSLSSAGDVNGDGYDDLIIGANNAEQPDGASGEGETYVVYGGERTAGVLALTDLDGSNGFVLASIDDSDNSGYSVSSAGDVNGDGYDDLIIGARLADPNGDSTAGETYVVYGGASAPGAGGVLALSALDGTNGFTLNGIDANDQSGISVSSAGDVNGDGYDDLIIGASAADPGGNSGAGETYVVYGGAGAPGAGGVLELSALDGTNGFALNGIDADDESGFSVSSAGDVNGDGYDDLIIGATNADPNGTDSGETYVVYGGATGTESLAPVTAQGTVAADNFTGNGGADSFTGIATGDVVRGGAGDDNISVTALDFADIDGGTGRDTLVLAGADLSLDLTGAANGGVDSVEVVDLSGTGANTLVLDALAVFDLTEERDGGIAGLDVLGGADDRVEFRNSFTASGTATEGDTTYTIYRAGNAEVRVQTGVQVQIPAATAPVFSSDATAVVAENQGLTYTAVATDADGDALSYSLSGTDAALFRIGPNTGVVNFRQAPDFEMPGDDDDDNVYDITVTASDGSNAVDQAVAITVTNVNDNAPVFSSAATASVAENQTATVVYVAVATDVDDDTLSYSLSGTDAARFTIDLRWGVVSFITVPDFENPGDAGGDNVYDITVTASDGTNSTDQTVAITVTDEYDPVPLSTLDGTNGFILNGIDANDRSGRSVSSAGDVNGDGYDDLIIGADFADPNGAGSGETYVVYGGASAPGTGGGFNLSTLDGTNGFILNGIDAGDRSGWSVSSAGDVNGDGYDDLIIGAGFADPNENSSGETYVVYGGASVPVDENGGFALSSLDGSNGFILNGIDESDRSGFSVSSAGDVNGDGYDDLIIGAQYADANAINSGESYVVYGGASAPGTGGVLELSALNGTNGFILNGIDAYDHYGGSVSSAGDVNGDGYDDLIIGADLADPNGNNEAGETYIVYGGASAPGTDGVLDLSDLDGTNGFILNGIDESDYSGISVSSAGDVNGDGYDDLIIGAYGADSGGRRDAGETYVIYGGASAPGTGGRFNLSTLDGTDGFILGGIDGFDESGRSVSSAGDVNGDGYDDLIIGAFQASPNGHYSGETYVIYGGATGTESLTPVTAQGTAAADNFTGNADDDSFTAIATNDVVRGAAGDDRISVTALDFAAIDGGTGQDTLVLDGAGLSLDLTGAGHAGVDSVEVFDLSGTGANTLVLDALAVFDLTEERAGGMATLDVLGDANDTVDLTVGNFTSSGTETEDGTTYNVYQDGNAEVRVQTGVQVQIAAVPVFTSDASASVVENQTVAYEAQATDADSDTLNYSLSGTDAALFMIDPATGVVSFITAPDFENPGDAGGDNVYDITVTASDGTHSTDQTVAITVTDEYDPVPLSTLDGTNGFILNGIDADDLSGYSVSSAGDVNGDGYDDLIIGAYRADPNGDSYAGETYVVYGGASAPGTNGVLDLSDLDGTNGFILNGIDAVDISGRSVSSAGDVNGDGYDDLIIGARYADPNEDDNAGETYVVYGGASAPGTGGGLNLSTLNGTNGFILNGIDADDRSGHFVSSAGDVNGDGYDDLIIGAYRADPNGDSRAGETYVVYGGASAPGTDGVLDLGALDGTDGFILNGIDANDRSGVSVSSAGDVNGDGYDDLIIGAYRADPNGDSRAGETYVVYGGASAPGTDGVLDLSMLNGSNGFILNGIDASDFSGNSVSSAGDVNGDGYDDLIIGANGADPNGDRSGETYIVYGGANAPGTNGVLDLSDLDGTIGFILNGIDANDYSGRSVSSAGDVNGDGYDDLIIGARDADPNGDSNAGETYIVYGGASAPGTEGALDLSDVDGTNGFILTGIDDDDQSGQSVSSAGDVNGDGYDDLIIGANGADPSGRSSGETYVIYGGATGTESLTPVTAQGTAAADNFTGNAGADSFTAIATNDVVRGGAGDDRISVTALDFAAIDGGTGQDTLVLDGAGLSLDLTGAGHAGVDSVEVFDLSGTGANTLVLDAQAVFDLTEERAGGIATLDVLGDANDTVELTVAHFTSSGTETEDGTTYTVYRAGNAEVRVQTGVEVPNLVAAIDLSLLNGTNGFILNGIYSRDNSGRSVSSAGDVNGDGYDDLIIGVGTAHRGGDRNVGETYVVYGGASAPGTRGRLNLSTLDGTDGFILTGIDALDYSGLSVSSAGDVNRDGYDDLIIGARDADPNGSNSGETYVVYGGASAPGTDGVLDLSMLNGSNGFILNGINRYDQSGWSVSSAGDVNGDGYDDLIIGAISADPNGNRNAGETYVVYGGASAPGTGGRLNLSTLDGTNGFIFNGIDASDRSGWSVSSAGDVNGDGYDDLIIGAIFADPNGSASGETYVVYGGASAPGTDGVLDLSMLNGSNGFILNGIDASDYSGNSVSSAGDVNGDGYDDLIIGARDADPNGDRSGETYIVYGGANAPGTGGVLDLSDLDGTNGFILNGIDAHDRSGRSVSSAGDVNGDGYDDLIIGAHLADPNRRNYAGETYVVYPDFRNSRGCESLTH